MPEQLTQVNFDLIRYANCWEDADVLLQGLNPQAGGRHLSIASAGDNSFSLLTTDPEIVVAADISKVQLFLVELKKLAIQKMDHTAYLEFIGFRPSTQRLKIFQQLKADLSTEARIYWSTHTDQIEAGLVYQGKFEKYFLMFSKRILPLIHNQKRVAQLFKDKSPEAQQAFYAQSWNSWRWRLFFKIFFSKLVMGKYGRDPEFLKQVEVPVSESIFQQAASHLSSTYAQDNYFLRFILSGAFGKALPHYAREENYAWVQQNLDKLHLYEGLAEDALIAFPQINYLNLSNIFEYMDSTVFEAVGHALLRHTSSDARFAYWNLMVPRTLPTQFPTELTACEEICDDLAAQDKGFFYSQFFIDQKS